MALLVQHEPPIGYYSFGVGGTKIAQCFLFPSGNDLIEEIEIPLTRIGSVAGDVTVSIYATSGGVPTGSALTSGTYTANSIPLTGTWINFDVSNLLVSPSTVYAIVMEHNGTSTSSMIAWNNNLSATYSEGNAFYSYAGGAGWNQWPHDLAFRVYGTQSAVAPTVTTGSVSSITSTSASVAGNVISNGGSAITQRGVCYVAGTGTPTVSNTKVTVAGTTGAFSASLTGLGAGIQYSARAYAINAMGTSYGSVVSFTTSTSAPIGVTTVSVSQVQSTSANITGTLTSEGGSPVLERGICWGTSTNPTTSGSKAIGSPGAPWTCTATNLNTGTLYYVRAYARNSIGTSYGANLTFTTLNLVKYWAQSFTAPATGKLEQVQLYLKNTVSSSGSGLAKVSIWDDSAGSPGTKLEALTSQVVNSGTYSWITFSANTDLTATDVYWIVLEDPYIIGSYYVNWGANTAGGYADGQLKYTVASAPTTWINTGVSAYDAAFKALVTPSFTPEYNIKLDGRKRWL